MKTTKPTGCTGHLLFQALVWMVSSLPTRSPAQVVAWGTGNAAPPAMATDQAFAAASFDDHLYLFAKGTNDQLIYFSSFDSIQWTAWSQVPGNVLSASAPAAASFGGSLFLFISDANEEVMVNRTSDGVRWSGWSLIPGVFTDVALGASEFGGKLYVFATAMKDQRVYFATFDGNIWSGWSQVPGSIPTGLPPGPCALSGKLYLFANGVRDQEVYFTSFDGNTWMKWSVVPGGLLTDAALGSVAVSGRLNLFAQGASSQQVHFNSFDGSDWAGWFPVPGSNTTDVAVAAAGLGDEIYMIAKPPAASSVKVSLGLGRSLYNLTDVIPNDLSSETNHHGEPSIAVWRSAPGSAPDLIVSAFEGLDVPQPYFRSADGGVHWTTHEKLLHGDTTVEWSQDGTAYAALLKNVASKTINVRKSTHPLAGDLFTDLAGSHFSSGGLGPDQPRLEVANFGGDDRIYVGFNDLGRFDGKTASIDLSLDGGTTWNNVPGLASLPPIVIEKVTPAEGQDSPAVQVAAAKDGHTVYALFQRWSSYSGDMTGDVVVVRDDNQGLGGFGALGNGTRVETGVVLPWTTTLGLQRLGGDISIAVSPTNPQRIYVAYVVLTGGSPHVRVRLSSNGGANFGPVVFNPSAPSALPVLAVADNGTVGLLYTTYEAGNLITHFLQAPYGLFGPGSATAHVYASFPSSMALFTDYTPYVGDYQDLEAVGNVFYAVFCASNDPLPSHFPRGVRYQRNVRVGGVTRNNFILTAPGTLVDAGGNNVAVSLDPFFFSEVARTVSLVVKPPPNEKLIPIKWLEENSVFLSTPVYRPEFTPQLSGSPQWGPLTNPVVASNGEFSVALDAATGSGFFRLRRQPSSNAVFTVTGLAGRGGAVDPADASLKSLGGRMQFTAFPYDGYAVDTWFLDGQPAQTGGTSFTLSYIDDDHHVEATFAPSNDLSLVIVAQPSITSQDEGGFNAVVGENLDYVITVANTGINPESGIVVTDTLPRTVNFVAAQSSQGTTAFASGTVTCSLGNLARGASATVKITVVPTTEGELSNSAKTGGNEPELDVSNNQDTASIMVQAAPAATPARSALNSHPSRAAGTRRVTRSDQ